MHALMCNDRLVKSAMILLLYVENKKIFRFIGRKITNK